MYLSRRNRAACSSSQSDSARNGDIDIQRSGEARGQRQRNLGVA